MGRPAAWGDRTAGEWATLWNAPLVEIHRRIGSTNDRALELAAAGASPFTAVVADEQTRGRGRGGNEWHAPAGSGLLVSVVLPGAAAPSPALPLVVGLAAARALESEAPGVEVRIKWPNDLYIGDAKVGGVLCEGRTGSAVVAGIGLNIHTPPGGFPAGVHGVALDAVCGSRAGHPAKTPPRAAVATALMGELRPIFARPLIGFPPHLRAEFARRDFLRGRQVETNRGRGEAVGVAEDGALLLRGADGDEVRVVSGSVDVR